MYKITWTSQKIVYAVIGAFLSFTADVHNAMVGLLICVLADTVTGFWAASYRGQIRESAKLGNFVKKIISYFGAGLLVLVGEKMVFPSYATGMELTRLVFMSCALLEIYSVTENLYDITGLRIFRIITQFSLKKIGEKVGLDLGEITKGGKSGKKVSKGC